MPFCINTQDWLVTLDYRLNSADNSVQVSACMLHYSYNHHRVASVRTHGVK